MSAITNVGSPYTISVRECPPSRAPTPVGFFSCTSTRLWNAPTQAKGYHECNLFRLCAHSPVTLPHIISLGTAIYRDTSLPPHLRELVCLLNAQRLRCDYQWRQHAQIARHSLVDEAKIAALAAGQISGDLWSTEEKVLLAFMDQVIGGPEVSETVFAEARKYYSDRILVEVVTMQGYYYSLAKISTVFRVELESSSNGEPRKSPDSKDVE